MALQLLMRGAEYWPPAIAAVFSILLFVYIQGKIASSFLFVMLAVSPGFGVRHRVSSRTALDAFSGTLIACTVGTTLPWWRLQESEIEASTNELILFAALLVTATSILLLERPTEPANRVESATSLDIYAAIVGYISYSLAATSDSDAMITLWHHWGAYIDPSELVMGGARLFHDIPAQYGAGPTLLLSPVCGADCWSAIYWVVGTATFTCTLLIGAMAWQIGSGGRYRNVLLALSVVTYMFWIAYPPAAFSPNVMPSTSGIRFLPVVMLGTWILFTANRTPASPRPLARAGRAPRPGTAGLCRCQCR